MFQIKVFQSSFQNDYSSQTNMGYSKGEIIIYHSIVILKFPSKSLID